MRIAQVTPYFLPVEGGVERHVLNLSRQLKKRGHELDIYTSSYTRDSQNLESSSVIEGLPVYRYPCLARLGEFGQFWPGFALDLLNRHYDVIHAHVYRHPHTDISMIVSKIGSSGSVLTAHSPFHPTEVRRPFARDLATLYDKTMAKLSLRGFDKIVALTDAEARILISLGARKERIVVIPHGVEQAHFSPSDFSSLLSGYALKDKDIILYLGRVNRTKGLDVLIDAFAKVCPLVPNAHLIIAGPVTSPEEAGFREELLRKSRSMGITDRVTFTGRLSEDEKLAAYESCRFFVLPSVYEPYGIVLLEAAAHRKPLIATRTDGPNSLVREGQNGYLVEPNNRDDLARVMLKLLRDDSLLEELSKGARETASEHSWERVATELEGAYRATQ